MTTRKYVPEYSLGEELINSITHGIGAGLSVVALVLCVVKATTAGGKVSAVLYGTLLIMLYTISCIYHALSPRLRGKRVLRVIDHANVFLVVAGTYMPICLSLLDGVWGWLTFGIVWLVTIVAVVFSCVDVDRFQMIGVVCNLILGWGALLLLPVLIELVPWTGLWLLIFGGVAYSLGAILYVVGAKVPYMHSIFHFFVLMGSILHFFFIYLYCL
ncbi:hemolysin III family protein [Candidatus Saccharibacteria bacterium]|nr:hemolysin III family protein [Candidatus Saccharibacteria bacterium]